MTNPNHNPNSNLNSNPAPIFDKLSKKFTKNIYDTFKGRLRLAILERDFKALNLHQDTLNILDIGAGQGQFAGILAEKGHNLTLVEPAMEMLTLAKERFAEKTLTATFHHQFLDELPALDLPQYDLITCHAMLEWLPEPYQFFEIIKPLLKENGKLSLLFYNREGLIYHNLIRGNFHYVDKGNFSGEKGGFTPISPIDTEELETFLNAHNYTILKKSGIRTYYDFMAKEARNRISEEDHLRMELHYSELETYLPHARYHHWLIQK